MGKNESAREWSPEELGLLMRLAVEFSKQSAQGPLDRSTFLEHIQGTKIAWKNLASTFNAAMVRSGRPERTPNSLRNRVYRMAKGAKEAGDGRKVYLCRGCGQPRRGHVCTLPASKTAQTFGVIEISRDAAQGMDE